MGFRNGSYASLFSVAKGSGNFYDVNLATSKKDRRTGEYATDFRGFVRFVGKAATDIAKLDGRDSKNEGNHPIGRIKLGEVEVTNSYNKEKKVGYTNFVVYTFEETDGSGSGNTNSNSKKTTANDYANNVPTGDDESLFT